MEDQGDKENKQAGSYKNWKAKSECVMISNQ
jgi:hypothetical protein